MSTFSRSYRAALLAAVLPVILAACGGGGGGSGGGSGGGGGGGGAPPPNPGAPLPIAIPDSVVTERDKSLTVPVLANDTVSSGGTLTLAAATAPAHGTATVSGNTVVYTPASGYYGPDTFTYSINAGSGSVTATAQVKVSVQVPLTLAGRVVNAPAGATAAVVVGGTSYPATLDGNGNFSTAVKLDAPTSMVSVVAQGSGGAAAGKLTSLVGDSQLLLALAGSKSTVTVDDVPGLNVNNVSTAVAALATRANGGAVPASQAALEAASSNIAVTEMFQMATLIRMATPIGGVAAKVAMPAGASDTLALASNSTLYTAWAKQAVLASADGLAAEIDVTRQDARLASVPAVKADVSKSLNFYGNEGCCTAAAAEVILNPDGTTGQFYKSAARANALVERKDGMLVLTMTSPHVSSEYFNREVAPFGQYEVRFTTKKVTIQQFTGTAGKGFVRLTQSGTTEYPTGEQPNGDFSTTRLYAFSEWSTMTAPADLAGTTYAGLVITPDPLAIIVNQLLVSFNADGTASSPQRPAFQIGWKLEAGKLVVDFPNSRHTMARVRVNADGEERWLVRIGYPNTYTVEEVMMVRVTPGLAFTETSVINGWLAGANNEIAPGFVVNVLANSVSNDATLALTGAVTPVRPTSWTINAGALVMSSYLLPDGTTTVGSCPPATTCTLRTERTWNLLRDTGTAIFVYEKVMFSASDVRYRVNRYVRTK